MNGNSNDETYFPYILLLSDTQDLKIRKNFANGWPANMKFSKIQLSKMIKSGRLNFLDLLNPAEAVDKIANMLKNLSNKVSLNEKIKTVDNARRILRDYKRILGTGRNLTHKEIK